MLQTLLAARFKLEVRHETREIPVYALTLAKTGPGPALQKEGGDPERRPAPARTGTFHMVGAGTMQVLTERIANLELVPDFPLAGRPVLDRTGLHGVYSWTILWDDGEDFSTVLRHDLGLNLESQRAKMDILIIEHIERPSGN